MTEKSLETIGDVNAALKHLGWETAEMLQGRTASGKEDAQLSNYSITKDSSGHWLVVHGTTQKPVALFYAHNVADHVARKRAERFVKASR